MKNKSIRNEFAVGGMCTKVSEMKNEKNEIVGLFVTLATIGESFQFFISNEIMREQKGIPIIEINKYYEVRGHLKSKIVNSRNNKPMLSSGWSVDEIESIENPFMNEN